MSKIKEFVRKLSVFLVVMMIVGFISPVGVKAEREYYVDSINLFCNGLVTISDREFIGDGKEGLINRKGK